MANTLGIKHDQSDKKNMYFDFGLSSRFVAHLRSLCVHVHISLVLYLATKHLCPGF